MLGALFRLMKALTFCMILDYYTLGFIIQVTKRKSLTTHHPLGTFHTSVEEDTTHSHSGLA